MSKALGIIPARFGSTRFPGKPLHLIAGKPLLRRVWERCVQARTLDSVIIATDDMRIADAAFDWGAEIALTSASHESGTDRAAEVAGKARQFEFIVNIQGDEPLVEPRLIDRLVMKLQSDPAIELVTAAHPFTDAADAASPHQVKVVLDRNSRALYFSRSPIPFSSAANARKTRSKANPGFLRHQGIYGFRRDLLLRFVRWSPTPLERAEALEQLRALENGVTVHVLVTKHGSPGVDTLQDAKNLERTLTRRKAAKRNRRRR
jgi:3-deoxy-manno-octulosonate cytidylyltransferase (CMP-KDO synthetase)